MKVIGDSKNEVVVIMTKEEAANLAGFHSEYTLKDKGKSLSPGFEFSIGELYQNASDTLNFYRETQDSFKRTQGSINKLMGLIAPSENK